MESMTCGKSTGDTSAYCRPGPGRRGSNSIGGLVLHQVVGRCDYRINTHCDNGALTMGRHLLLCVCAAVIAAGQPA